MSKPIRTVGSFEPGETIYWFDGLSDKPGLIEMTSLGLRINRNCLAYVLAHKSSYTGEGIDTDFWSKEAISRYPDFLHFTANNIGGRVSFAFTNPYFITREERNYLIDIGKFSDYPYHLSEYLAEVRYSEREKRAFEISKYHWITFWRNFDG